MDSKQETVIRYIQEHLLAGKNETELFAGDDLLGSGLIDSMGIMKLVGFIEDEFHLTIPPEDIVIENFMDVNAIGRYLEDRI